VARIRIIDATGSDLGRRVAGELAGGPLGDTSLTQVIVTSPAEAAVAESSAAAAVRGRALKGYLVLGAGTLRGDSARYLGANATALADMRRIESVVARELTSRQLREAGLSPQDADRITRQRFRLHAERLTTRGRGGSGRVNVMFGFGLGMLLYVTILMYGQNVLRGVI
jgi:ABC-2 type transport system permease protein